MATEHVVHSHRPQGNICKSWTLICSASAGRENQNESQTVSTLLCPSASERSFKANYQSLVDLRIVPTRGHRALEAGIVLAIPERSPRCLRSDSGLQDDKQQLLNKTHSNQHR